MGRHRQVVRPRLAITDFVAVGERVAERGRAQTRKGVRLRTRAPRLGPANGSMARPGRGAEVGPVEDIRPVELKGVLAVQGKLTKGEAGDFENDGEDQQERQVENAGAPQATEVRGRHLSATAVVHWH